MRLRERLAGGAMAGVAGLLVFGAIHWWLLFPTFNVFTFGLPIVLAGGLALGWVQHELARASGTGLTGWRAVAALLFVLVTVAPGAVLNLLLGPVTEPIAVLALALVVPAGVGYLVGRRRTRHWRGAAACAAALALPGLFLGGALLTENLTFSNTVRSLVTVAAALASTGAVLGLQESKRMAHGKND